MTVPEFLATTHYTQAEIAEKCDVHVSRVSAWANNKCVPEGPQLLRLVELSDYKITSHDLPRRNRGGHFRADAQKPFTKPARARAKLARGKRPARSSRA